MESKNNGLAMMGWAIIIAIIILIFPFLIYWFAWLAVISIFLLGLFTFLQG
jgi:hypothetical protein